MPKIVEYTNKDDKLTPLGEGETAWTGAGRRIAPAYNEAATLIRESERGIVQGGEDIASATGLGVKGAENVAASLGHQVRAGENVARAAGDIAKSAETVERAAGEQTAAGKAQGQAEVLKADQIEKLEKAFLSQYKDLFDIGEGGATKAARGGGGGFNTRGGGGSSDPFGIMSNRFPQDYGGGNEILNGATALTSKLRGKSPAEEDTIVAGDGSRMSIKEYNRQQNANWGAVDKYNQQVEGAANAAYYGTAKAAPKSSTDTDFGSNFNSDLNPDGPTAVPNPTAIAPSAPPSSTPINWDGLIGQGPAPITETEASGGM